MIYDLGEKSSIVTSYVAELRDVEVQNDRQRFRRNVERIGEVIAYEISKTLDYREARVQTPLGQADVRVLNTQPVIGTILRAGLPLHQGLLNVFDEADNAFISAYRRHSSDGSFEIELGYLSCPPLVNRVLILSDPMLATGASMVSTIQLLQEQGSPSEIHIAVVISSRQGIERVCSEFPDVHIWTAVVDDHLDSRGYIVPGLGDAGDLAYGSKLQS